MDRTATAVGVQAFMSMSLTQVCGPHTTTLMAVPYPRTLPITQTQTCARQATQTVPAMDMGTVRTAQGLLPAHHMVLRKMRLSTLLKFSRTKVEVLWGALLWRWIGSRIMLCIQLS